MTHLDINSEKKRLTDGHAYGKLKSDENKKKMIFIQLNISNDK